MMKFLRLIGAFLNTVGWVSPNRAGHLAFELFSKPRRERITHQETLALLSEAEPLNFMYEGYELIGYRWGQEHTGLKVMLIHGWESHTGRWYSLIHELLEAGAQVYAFDGPASGNSPGKRLTLNLYIDAAELFEQAYGPFDGFVGHSLGGGVAIQLSKRLTRDRQPGSMCILGSYDEVENIFNWYQNATGFSDRVRRGFDNKVIAFVEGQSIREYSNTEALHQLGHIDGLVIHGRRDNRVSYEEGENLAAAWPNSRLVLIDDLGHSLQDARVDQLIVDHLVHSSTPSF